MEDIQENENLQKKNISSINEKGGLFNPNIIEKGTIQKTYRTIKFNEKSMRTTQDPLEELKSAKYAYIFQEIDFYEIISGCQTKNRYHVYIVTQNGECIYLFKCKEDSSCLSRTCCHPRMRPLNMRVKHIRNDKEWSLNEYSDVYAVIEKPFKCRFLCLCRPEVTTKINNKVIGTVVEPFTCCSLDPLFHIKNSDGKIAWKVMGQCCSCGICCWPCHEAYFQILPGNSSELLQSDGGKIKKFAEGSSQCLSSCNKYELLFPKDSSPQEKMMLISTVLMIDYQFFERKNNTFNS